MDHADVGSAGVTLASPAVPDNMLTIASDLRAEHVQPNLRAIAPEVSENELGVVVTPVGDDGDVDVASKPGTGKGKHGGKRLSGAKNEKVEAKAGAPEEEDESDIEGGEEEAEEIDPEVEVPVPPKQKVIRKPKATSVQAKARGKTVGVSSTAKGNGGGAAGKAEPVAKSVAKVKAKVKAKSSGSGSDRPAAKGKVIPKKNTGLKSKAGHDVCDEAGAAVEEESPADVYAGKAYVDVMALFLERNGNDRKKWMSSDVRKRAIDVMSDAERKRRRL